MQTANWVTPLYLAGLSVAVLAAAARGRRRFDAMSGSTRWLLGGFAAVLALTFVAAAALNAAAGSVESLVIKGAGVGLLGAAAWFALGATRARQRADAFVGGAVTRLDAGIRTLRLSRRDVRWGVFQGRLGARTEVTSPGGVVCAFFDAELRGVAADGHKGPLLSTDRAYSPLITLHGERAEVAVRFAPSAWHAPVQIRRSLASAQLAAGDEASVFAGAQPVTEVLSYERVGKLGEACVVMGELRRGAAPGSFVLQGPGGGPAVVAMGTDVEQLRAQFARRAWRLFATAGALVLVAAFLLSGRV